MFNLKFGANISCIRDQTKADMNYVDSTFILKTYCRELRINDRVIKPCFLFVIQYKRIDEIRLKEETIKTNSGTNVKYHHYIMDQFD